MPGVKRLYQESQDVSKAEWIRWHYFGAVGLLLLAGSALFAGSIMVDLQDGIQVAKPEPSIWVDKMTAHCPLCAIDSV
jgi:hypothetical protein